MSRGAPAQVGVLALLSGLFVVATAVLLIIFAGDDLKEADGSATSAGHVVWKALMHTLDAGTIGGDNGSWAFLFILLFGTFGGIFVVSAFIGILNSSLEERLANLRK